MLRKLLLIGFMAVLFYAPAEGAGEYFRKSVVDNKVDLLVPTYLVELPEDVAGKKVNPLTLDAVFVNRDKTAVLSVFHAKRAGRALHQENMQEIRRLLQNENYNDINWINKQVVKLEVKTLNGRNFGIRQIKSQQVTGGASETQYITSLNGYEIVFSLSYPTDQEDTWKPVGEKIFNSIVLHE